MSEPMSVEDWMQVNEDWGALSLQLAEEAMPLYREVLGIEEPDE